MSFSEGAFPEEVDETDRAGRRDTGRARGCR